MVDDDPEALHCVLQWLYTRTYASARTKQYSRRKTDAEWIEGVKRDAKIFSLADKYDIEELKELVRARRGHASGRGYLGTLPRIAQTINDSRRAVREQKYGQPSRTLK